MDIAKWMSVPHTIVYLKKFIMEKLYKFRTSKQDKATIFWKKIFNFLPLLIITEFVDFVSSILGIVVGSEKK